MVVLSVDFPGFKKIGSAEKKAWAYLISTKQCVKNFLHTSDILKKIIVITDVLVLRPANKVTLKIFAQRPARVAEVITKFHQSLHANSGIKHKTMS